eukprot:GFUD01009318.1.p1 GENE.GFUD01009318.1~~GFUD01009318.1.p1  ORF type:complete len:441 (-),score=78.68 GFUD01009318.1:159-1481(-)
MMLKDFLRNRVVLVDLLAVLFGISSWISINGLWVELPLLVQHLPEGWALPSYLSIIVQMANIGPITYGLMRSCMKTPPSQNRSITLLLAVGCGASLALALGWDLTSVIDGKMRSTGLFICVFFLSLVDCTSSVLFLPYMGIFRQVYLNSYLIGEGMSGFVPSIAALAQGVSGNPVCVTLENGTSIIQEVTDQARFTTSGFFIFLLGMMILSLLAFLFLQHLPTARSERISSNMSSRSSATFSDALQDTSPDAVDADTISQESMTHHQQPRNKQPVKYNKYLLLSIQCFICFLSNGALPSIQSYSCLPYGNTVYHMAVTLNAMANPMMAFLAFFLPCTRQTVITALAVVGSLLSAFIITTALYSPAMIGTVEVGGTFVVLTWVVSGAMFSYVKVSVAGMCRDSGWLFHCGVLTQVGSAGGALLMFILVNQVNMFQGYYVTC